MSALVQSAVYRIEQVDIESDELVADPQRRENKYERLCGLSLVD
jgi:hypothetical protein